LINTTDPYFRSFDNNFPDFYREKEWEFEFEQHVKKGNLPALSMVRLMHDHMGSFGTAIEGVNTPETQQADNDYAVAKLIEKVSKSPYASSTLICILEDDSQNGADHVDSHRSTAYIVGPYVKHGAVVSTAYTTQNMLRTIEEVLGIDHVDVLTASEKPMTDVFDINQGQWSFRAAPSDYLYNTQLPLPPRSAKAGPIPKSTHDAKYWADRTKEFDFTREDNLKDPDKFNRIIWEGLHVPISTSSGCPGRPLAGWSASDKRDTKRWCGLRSFHDLAGCRRADSGPLSANDDELANSSAVRSSQRQSFSAPCGRSRGLSARDRAVERRSNHRRAWPDAP